MKLSVTVAGVAGLFALAAPAFASGNNVADASTGTQGSPPIRVAQVAAVLPARDPNAPKTRRTFPDVPPEHWAAQAVQLMADLGIMIGYPDGTFNGGNEPAR